MERMQEVIVQHSIYAVHFFDFISYRGRSNLGEKGPDSSGKDSNEPEQWDNDQVQERERCSSSAAISKRSRDVMLRRATGLPSLCAINSSFRTVVLLSISTSSIAIVGTCTSHDKKRIERSLDYIWEPLRIHVHTRVSAIASYLCDHDSSQSISNRWVCTGQ